MDGRPLSGASFGSAPSNTAGPSHKRNTSTNKPTSKPPSGPTTISLFIANLRLLNLDLLADWPNITTSSFGNQDARTRTKCTEYALYQLFRTYDPATTSDKLQPFFPPLEPLQSVNLRSALFRCLNDLKRNGVLSKETVLRKTMLDECSGDKFWEACLAFSAAVLRKVTLEKRAKYGRPVAERHGTAHTVGKAQRDSLLPLAIAHKAALSKVLEKRKAKRDTYTRLRNVLIEKDGELRQRKTRAQDNAQQSKYSEASQLNAVEKAIHKSWVGSTELKDALIEGDTCAKGDGILVQSFDKLWTSENLEQTSEITGAEVGLLQSLNSKVNEQSARLRRWQSYHERLVAAKPASARSSRPGSVVQKTTVKFDRHRDLSIADANEDDMPRSTTTTAVSHRRHDNIMKYDHILTSMREELRKNSSHHAQPAPAIPPLPSIQPLRRAQTTPVPPRRPSLNVNTIAGAQDSHRRSPSQTAVPFLPRMSRRVSSQSRSYEKPKVESQRQPIPLKAELFSPLKEKRRSGLSPSCEMSDLPSPAEEEPSSPLVVAQASSNHIGNVAAEAERTDRLNANPAIDGPGLDTNCGSNSLRSDQPCSITQEEDSSSPPSAQFMSPAMPAKSHETTTRTARPSLSERTRMSIAFNSSDKVTSIPSDRSNDTSPDAELHDEPLDLDPAINDRRATLLARTRQSMGGPLTQEGTSISKKPSHHRTRTSIYPVNQFETPKKPRRSTIGLKERRDVTPLDQLLSPDAEYASVFKSRPRIALSPVLSPRSEAELQLHGTLEGDVGQSSPLVGVGARG